MLLVLHRRCCASRHHLLICEALLVMVSGRIDAADKLSKKTFAAAHMDVSFGPRPQDAFDPPVDNSNAPFRPHLEHWAGYQVSRAVKEPSVQPRILSRATWYLAVQMYCDFYCHCQQKGSLCEGFLHFFCHLYRTAQNLGEVRLSCLLVCFHRRVLHMLEVPISWTRMHTDWRCWQASQVWRCIHWRACSRNSPTRNGSLRHPNQCNLR